jgi:IS5 family transposase
MLRDRYARVDLFALAPALQLQFEPVLARLDALLDDDTLFQAVRRDLAHRWTHTEQTGRPSTPVEVILRLLIVRRLYAWSYAQTEQFVTDSLVLRQFCRLGLQPVPDHTTLLRWAHLVQPATLQLLLDHVVALARQLRVTRGRKLRLDSTVVATPIHYPTDSSLLVDGVRVLGRLLRRAKPAVAAELAGVRDAFRTRTRSARQQLQRIHRVSRRKGAAVAEMQREAYAKLCSITRKMVRQAERVQQALSQGAAETRAAAQRVTTQFDHFLPLVRQVIRQAERRVLQGEAVPASEKIVSLYEPHTAIIPRHKAGQPVDFGRKVWFGEADGGIITDYQVLDGAPPDAAQVAGSLERHRQQFRRAPVLLTGDRGCATATVRRQVAAAGVKRVALPHTGPPTAASQVRERQRWYRRAYRWRAGIEGRISVLKGCYGLRRGADHGADGCERWVGWGVLTANLVTIARATAAQ